MLITECSPGDPRSPAAEYPARYCCRRPAHRPETAGLLAHPPPPGTSRHWLAWRRRHQALSAWYHQRTRLARDKQILLVS